MKVEPYLTFNGRCQEAIDFYKRVLGAKVEAVMSFKEAPEPMPEGMLAPGWEGKVMHSAFKIGDSIVMASDGMGPGATDFKGVSLTLSADSDAEADRLFKALADGGQVQMPMDKTFFASRFGMVADRFGVSWMVIAGGEMG